MVLTRFFLASPIKPQVLITTTGAGLTPFRRSWRGVNPYAAQHCQQSLGIDKDFLEQPSVTTSILFFADVISYTVVKWTFSLMDTRGMSSGIAEERLLHSFLMENLQVAMPLPRPIYIYRDADWSLMPITTPPLAVTVELGYGQFVDRSSGHKLTCLLESILSGRAISNKEHLVGCVGELLSASTLRILVSSSMEPFFVMQTAGCIDYCDICSGSLGTLQCVVGHGCRVAAKFLLDYGHSGTLTHTSSCSMAAARNVSAAPSTTLLPAFLNCEASFPIVVVLPTPFTPTTIIT